MREASSVSPQISTLALRDGRSFSMSKARAVQSRANCSDGAIDNGGSLRVTQFMQIAEHQRFAVMRGQSCNRRVQPFDHFLAREVGEQIVVVDDGSRSCSSGGVHVRFFAFICERHIGLSRSRQRST